ncbi:hypothetical protein KPL39_12295 [Clostridium gasigenes]|uniref:hypothetical protein n=1 Tax=Clostridium gasigenes TaxID=94869 RepID=UPI001C0C4DEE|nr:hypothetical protein [Clostridium gasigenes]MBU3137046.1 hypothetical protein [Clostridium gasigenes]
MGKFNLLKPHVLKRGDSVTTVSLSWGGTGDKEILGRYEQGKNYWKKYLCLKLLR